MTKQLVLINKLFLTISFISLFFLHHSFGQVFRHPGILNSKEQLEVVKTKIAAGEQPWTAAFEKLKTSPYSDLSFQPEPFPTVDCGSYNKPNLGCNQMVENAMAAYCQSLMWVFTNDQRYADKAIEIINSWSGTYQQNTNSNSRLVVSWATPWFVNAAELLRYTNSGWKKGDLDKFNGMLDKFLPYTLDETMPGNNWVLSAIEAHFAIAVFKDNRPLFNQAVERWKYRVKTYIYQSTDGQKPLVITGKSDGDMTNIWRSQTPGTEYIEGLGMETCRDLGHLNLGFSSMIYGAETAWQQGIDLFTPEQKRLSDFMELHGSWMTGAKDVPSDICGGMVKARLAEKQGIKAPDGGGECAWEIAFNHLHDRLKISLPYSLKMLGHCRPAPISKWVTKGETLTHANREFKQ